MLKIILVSVLGLAGAICIIRGIIKSQREDESEISHSFINLKEGKIGIFLIALALLCYILIKY